MPPLRVCWHNIHFEVRNGSNGALRLVFSDFWNPDKIVQEDRNPGAEPPYRGVGQKRHRRLGEAPASREFGRTFG